MAESSCDALDTSSQAASCDENDNVNEAGNYYGDFEYDNYEPLRRLLEDLERVGALAMLHLCFMPQTMDCWISHFHHLYRRQCHTYASSWLL